MLVAPLPLLRSTRQGPATQQVFSACLSRHWGQCGMLVTTVGDKDGPLGPNPNSVAFQLCGLRRSAFQSGSPSLKRGPQRNTDDEMGQCVQKHLGGSKPHYVPSLEADIS